MVRLFREVYPFNAPPKVVVEGGDAGYGIDKLVVTDTTLRDGQQGWRNLTVSESLKIYEVLADIGGEGSIISTELFLYTSKDREVAGRIAEYGYEYPKPIGWIRATMRDLELVTGAGLDEAVILTSISDYHIYYKLGLTREKAFQKYLGVVEEALKRGIIARCTLEDVTRADVEGSVIPFVRRLMRLSERYGLPVKVKLADTLGVGLPFRYIPLPRGIPRLVRAVIEEGGVPPEWVEFHGHNDLGLVVANHLAAWLHGASMSNCTLFGMGERAGNCPLEIMLLHYVGIKGGASNVRLKAIVRAAEVVRSMGFKIPEFYPLVGENAFRTKAGIHVDGLLKNPEVYLPFNPVEVLGLPYTVSITPYSGRAAVALWINAHVIKGEDGARVSKDDPRVKAIYSEVLKIFERKGRREPLTNEEMYRIVRKYFPSARGEEIEELSEGEG
ncbi:MAG: 2-isopropylmalate synthase [Desulfurococcales archaeon ex4484_204]|nr:MAG: 2-isopropylmalate synthase [Desulfurococcales archaeon ex4484_204]